MPWYLHFAFFIAMAVFGVEGLGLLTRPTHAHLSAISALTASEDQAAVGPLLEAQVPTFVAGTHLWRADKTAYFAVIAALTRLLPRLSQPEYRVLSPRQKQRLCQMLASEYPEVVMPALDALTRFGVTEAIPRVRRLVKRRAVTEDTTKIRTAALESLSRLYEG